MKNFLFAVVFLFAAPAWAATTYQYSGLNYINVANDSTPPAGSYTTSMSIQVSITVSDDAPDLTTAFTDLSAFAQSFTFSDGRNVLTEANSELDAFSLALNVDGEIFGHLARATMSSNPAGATNVGDQFVLIETQLSPDPTSADIARITECTVSPCTDAPGFFGEDSALAPAQLTPGVWSATTVIPVPAAVWLFGSALAGLGWLRRRQTA